MILFLLSKVTDIPPLTVETLSLCARPTLLAATRCIGFIVRHLIATGQPAQVLSSPPQNGPTAQKTSCLPSLPRERRTESQSTVAILFHSDPTTIVAVTDCIAALPPAAIAAHDRK